MEFQILCARARLGEQFRKMRTCDSLCCLFAYHVKLCVAAVSSLLAELWENSPFPTPRLLINPQEL